YALFNSKLLSYIYINFSTLALKDDYRQTTLKELRELPIKIINSDKQIQVVKKVEELEHNIYQFDKLYEQACAQLSAILNIKLNQALKNFYRLNFADFLKAVKKVTKLNKNLIQELDELRDVYSMELLELENSILEIDNEIENIVYKLYELTDEEIQKIEEHYSTFTNSSSLFSLK
ncbi:TPA: hypothetical protein QCY51_005762, partial [Bacillus cereus]|nr:hypothetical protein [Bacillus cereus]